MVEFEEVESAIGEDGVVEACWTAWTTLGRVIEAPAALIASSIFLSFSLGLVAEIGVESPEVIVASDPLEEARRLWAGFGGQGSPIFMGEGELKIVTQLLIKTSTTTLQNLMSIMAAMVSSWGLRRVGPKHTPKLPTVIKLSAQLSATLEKIDLYWKF